ncbi:Hau-lamin2 [Oopsacas minuta]|uniref:Hau-lamin2 n=1 Tax=Oopsacas minuta TaxID=111878 RepID=A0AAV7JS83_9METZ|nr:Hau-lamin2 [Oopsacas minuta]
MPRTGERDLIQTLNNRLQDYIEKVKSSSEQEDLEPRLDELVRNRDNDIDSIKSNYAENLMAARRTLDETAKEKAQYQLHSISLKTQIEKAKLNIARLKSENAETDNKLKQIDAETERAEQEKLEAENEKEELEKKKITLEAAIQSKRHLIDEAKLARVDTQNKLQTQREEVEFSRKLLQSETEHEEHLKDQLIAHFGKSEADLQADIQQRLEVAISNLTARTQKDLLNYRDDLETHFSDKKHSLEQDIELLQERIEVIQKEIQRLSHLQSSCDKRETSIRERMKFLNVKLQQQKDLIEVDIQSHAEKKRDLEETALSIEQNYLQQIEELRGLLELRNGLDLEVETYKRMLNDEERRLSIRLVHICNEGDQYTTDNPTTSVNNEFSCSFVISQVDSTGKFVEITNPSDTLLSLANHKIRNSAGDSEQVYKFHQRHRIAPGGAMKVWAHCPEAVRDPPNDIIWKKGSAWNIAAGQIELLNEAGEVISSYEKDAPLT